MTAVEEKMGKPSSSKDKDLSKSDRKFEKKLQFYTKVRETVALSANKAITKKKKLRSRQKKLKAYDLTTLTESLPELKAKQLSKRTSLKLNGRTRQKIVEKEGEHLKSVLSNPAFKLDPLAAIHQHLESTQPVVPVEKQENKSRKTGKKRGKKSKASSGAQTMEI